MSSGGPPHTAVTRSWPLLDLRTKLLFVPGIAAILCGGTWLVLAIVALATGPTAKIAEAQTFALAMVLPMLAITAIPMLALGGTLHARVADGELALVRVRAFLHSAPIVVALPVELRVRAFTSRKMRGYGSLVATQDGRERALVETASLPALQQIADELAQLLADR